MNRIVRVVVAHPRTAGTPPRVFIVVTEWFRAGPGPTSPAHRGIIESPAKRFRHLLRKGRGVTLGFKCIRSPPISK